MSDEYRNALAEGTVLDTYRIERVLGEGGFGVTYLVTELNLGKEYAIKELIPDGVAIRHGGRTVMARSRSMEDEFNKARLHFIKEARVLDALEHPAIVAVHRLLEANGTCYMVMDYVEGETLGAYLKRQGGNLGSRAEFEGIFYPIMDGLEVLHGKEMIHRDIKPGNIMVTPDGSPVLLDFGASGRVENHTVTMTQMVSAGYSPFEQYTTRAKQGPYTDIYALGATMVRAITGAKPDNAADRMGEDFYQSLTEQEELVIEYGEQLLLAIDAALLLKKSERPQSIEKWRELIGEEDSEEDPETQFELGSNYYHGWGVETDYEEAVKWYRKAADQGYAEAQYYVGWVYERGEGVKKDDEEAMKWFRKAADQGDASAQYHLALSYKSGEGVEKDDEEAMRWHHIAANQGNALAQYHLALSYQSGEGVDKDDVEAVKWLRLAAGQGKADAQYNLGVCYTNGRGVARDWEEAVKWYRLAANQGEETAQRNLGLMYANGEGVEKDDEEAVKWYRMAADQGDAEAQVLLGVSYGSGKGVKKNHGDAVIWYRKAAEQGHIQAQLNLAEMYGDVNAYGLCRGGLEDIRRDLSGIEKNPNEAVIWYREAAEQGDPEAQFKLGLCYDGGEGIEKDPEAALRWYRKARDQGHQKARDFIGEFRFRSLFFLRGRLGVKGFWASHLILFYLVFVVVALFEARDRANNDGSISVTLILFIYSMTPSYLRRLRDLGINRLSIIPMFIGSMYLSAMITDTGLEGDNFLWELICIVCVPFYIVIYARLFFVKRTPDGNRSSA